MRYFILFLVLVSIGLITYGLSLDTTLESLADKYIGAGTVLIFLVAMPLFLFKESKGKNFKDYMLTDESVRRMQGKEPKKPEDS
ncbi:hypothetical protein JQC67_04705 [Aurantibacter crassamenti]|uniref:hypothetical protein n=1 Tax=Aurantibacter crassamenti TaxID=1837375 RepID=UPI001939CCDB|nr:hypothetical protein [Aurantibacter crassamenti]MBM1105437.1 hypothetical protein [Aurantibacter crassamenti]